MKSMSISRSQVEMQELQPACTYTLYMECGTANTDFEVSTSTLKDFMQKTPTDKEKKYITTHEDHAILTGIKSS